MKRRTFLKKLYGLSSMGLLSTFLWAKQAQFQEMIRFRYANNTTQEEEEEEETQAQLKLLIPLYAYPDIQIEESTWQKLINLKEEYPEVEIMAIVNPENGHFSEENPDYTEGISKLIDAGIRVMGYIYTQYATRDTQAIINDLDAWQSIYQSLGIEGIFFDEASTDSQYIDYYQNLSTEARNRGFDYIILNAGITTDQSYIDSGLANLVVTYETTDQERIENPPSTYNTPSTTTELSLLIYEMETDHVDELIDFAREHQFSYIYFTEDGFDGNPWDSISIYLESEIMGALST